MQEENLISKIPEYALETLEKIQAAGFEAYFVGGCVRDLLMSQILNEGEGGKEPKDWDITTNALPEEIIKIFPKTVYENKFGTVAVIHETNDNNVPHETNSSQDLPALPNSREQAGTPDIIEITTYRLDSKYSDYRHPDKIQFSQKLEDDLKRRDFTMNAIALDPLINKDISNGRYKGQSKGHLVDPFGGIKDIESGLIKAVGNPEDRFQEDALRMLRAVRFSVQLVSPNDRNNSVGRGFTVSHETATAITNHSILLREISAERVRDEFAKIIMSLEPAIGIGLLQKFGLLEYIVPELLEGIGCEQKGEHIYDVYEHLLHALQHAADKKWPLDIRLSALFHDIGKPRTRRLASPKQPVGLRSADGMTKKIYTFYGHEVIGAKMVKKIMERLRFSGDLSEKVYKLVRYHMFFSDPEKITLSAVRRTIVNVGRENIWDLMQIRECDRVGMKKKEAPYRLRKYHAMIEEALRAPTSVGMLKIDGKIMQTELGITPGPRMGWILHALLEECLEDDSKNNSDSLKSRVLELNKLPDKELKALGVKGKQAKEEVEEEEIAKLNKKHGV